LSILELSNTDISLVGSIKLKQNYQGTFRALKKIVLDNENKFIYAGPAVIDRKTTMVIMTAALVISQKLPIILNKGELVEFEIKTWRKWTYSSI
jgi:hypothetical protein